MIWLRLFLGCILSLLLLTSGQAQTLAFKSCNCGIDSVCNQKKELMLREKIANSIIKERGYYFNDSIYFEYNFSEKGDIRINSRFWMYSAFVYQRSFELFKASLDSLCTTDTSSFSFNLVFELPESIQTFKEVEEIDRPIPVICNSQCNLKARRAMARYLAYNASTKISRSKSYKANHECKIYFHNGNILAFHIDSYGTEKLDLDDLISVFNESNASLIDATKLPDSDDQWMKFKISVERDSAEAYHYQLQSMDEMNVLKDKSRYLSSLFEFSKKYDQSGFLLNRLTKLGYATTDTVKLNNKTYPIDSIINYVEHSTDPANEDQSQHETAPNFPGMRYRSAGLRPKGMFPKRHTHACC